MDPKTITPFLIGALIVWGIYRRMRRTFGRQVLERRRLSIRVGIFAVIAALVILPAAHNLQLLGALAAGAAGGIALGILGLRHTVFEATPEGHFYTPHTYIGLVVTALFLGRMLYRVATVSAGVPTGGPPPSADPFAAYLRNPLSLAVFAVLFAYYITYYLGVLRHANKP